MNEGERTGIKQRCGHGGDCGLGENGGDGGRGGHGADGGNGRYDGGCGGGGACSTSRADTSLVTFTTTKGGFASAFVSPDAGASQESVEDAQEKISRTRLLCPGPALQKRCKGHPDRGALEDGGGIGGGGDDGDVAGGRGGGGEDEDNENGGGGKGGAVGENGRGIEAPRSHGDNGTDSVLPGTGTLPVDIRNSTGAFSHVPEAS
eukprot:232829-Karenia_brevis.AAC.1